MLFIWLFLGQLWATDEEPHPLGILKSKGIIQFDLKVNQNLVMRLVQKPGQAHQWDSISAISLSHFTVWLSVIMVLRDAKHLSHSIVLFGYCKHIYGLFLVFLNNINKRQVCSITCCIKGRSPGRKFEKILKMLSLNYFPITICTLKLPGFSNF